jgi:hypothetical protein
VEGQQLSRAPRIHDGNRLPPGFTRRKLQLDPTELFESTINFFPEVERHWFRGVDSIHQDGPGFFFHRTSVLGSKTLQSQLEPIIQNFE